MTKIIHDYEMNLKNEGNFHFWEKIIEMYSIIDEVKPQKKSLYGEGENGFNMDDVLNPKEELNLGDLLKELGVK